MECPAPVWACKLPGGTGANDGAPVATPCIGVDVGLEGGADWQAKATMHRSADATEKVRRFTVPPIREQLMVTGQASVTFRPGRRERRTGRTGCCCRWTCRPE